MGYHEEDGSTSSSTESREATPEPPPAKVSRSFPDEGEPSRDGKLPAALPPVTAAPTTPVKKLHTMLTISIKNPPGPPPMYSPTTPPGAGGSVGRTEWPELSKPGAKPPSVVATPTPPPEMLGQPGGNPPLPSVPAKQMPTKKTPPLFSEIVN